MTAAGNGKARRALVAGGAGFLGSHLCDALLGAGMDVVCVDSFVTGSPATIAHLAGHPGFRLVEADIRDDFFAGPVDQVFNLASAASPAAYQADPVRTMTTNVLGTLNLLKLAERNGAAFLQASTSEVYGDPEEHPQREDYFGRVNCTGPRACYDEGKRAAEALCFDFLRTGRADIRVARIFNTYGPRMQPGDGRIVSNFVVQALRGEPLTVYGAGSQTRSLCFVADMMAGLLALMNVEKNPGGPVNLGNPDETSVKDLAALVLAMTGSRSPLVHLPLPPDDPKRRCPDVGRAARLLGWSPSTPLSEGLARTVEHFRARLRDGLAAESRPMQEPAAGG